MSEEDHTYKDGDIVWVKFGNSWWPGEAIADEKRIPEDVRQLKKRPYCVVKFFQEDSYEYARNSKQIYPFQCSKKDEFIKKGLALYNAKKLFMEKFPDDVKHAENLTNPQYSQIQTKIITSDRRCGGGLVKEMWEMSPARRSIEFYENNHENNGTINQYEASSRRGSVTTILNITPNRSSLSLTTTTTPAHKSSSSSSSASVTPNTAASSQYRCNMCEFVTMRQNVLIMHRKSHSNSGQPGSGILMKRPSTTLITSSTTNQSLKTAPADENVVPVVMTGTPATIKFETVDDDKRIELLLTHSASTTTTPTTSTTPTTPTTALNRKKQSPIPRVSNSKRSLRSPRNPMPNHSPTIDESAANVIIQMDKTTISPTSNDSEIEQNRQQNDAVIISPTIENKTPALIRQRLLADWSDEEKDENKDDDDSFPTTTSDNVLQLPVDTTSTKRHSPTIVSMKTLEGAGKTLVLASSQETASKTAAAAATQRIRNIPKKDRLRDFSGSSGDMTTLDEQEQVMAGDDAVTVTGESIERTNASDETLNAESKEKTLLTTTEATTTTTEATTTTTTAAATTTTTTAATTRTESISCPTTTTTTTLSCFDFQEEEDENEIDVLQSIANYKKKYCSPDKEKSATNKSSATEQRDKQLSAEIDNLLEQTTVAAMVVTHVPKEDTVPSSVKGLPIKERGKRIFKSRNRARVEEIGEIVAPPPADVISKPIEDSLDIQPIENLNVKSSSITNEQRKTTRSTGKPSRVKVDQQKKTTTTSPINGRPSSLQENVKTDVVTSVTTSTETVQTNSEMVYVQRSSRRPYNHRIMRQLIEDDETSIPFIRHSPVELFSCDPSSQMDNGMNIVRNRRSKTRTPNLSLTTTTTTTTHDDTLNGGNGGSRTSSRNMITAPLTPTDETSSLGVSEAGAEFGSPASSLDDERLLTPPVTDVDTEQRAAEDFEGKNRNVELKLEIEEDDDDEIESPQHEALSGNELDENDKSKESSKKIKSPKKNLNPKEQNENILDEGQKTVGKRKSRSGTPAKDNKDLLKRSTRGKLQQKCKESTGEVEESGDVNSRRESPANVEKRNTPTRSSSRQAKLIKLPTDNESETSKSPVSLKERKTDEDVTKTERKQPTPSEATIESIITLGSAETSQKSSKEMSRSKTPNIETENGNEGALKEKQIQTKESPKTIDTERVESVENSSDRKNSPDYAKLQNKDDESNDINAADTFDRAETIEERIEADENSEGQNISTETTKIVSNVESEGKNTVNKSDISDSQLKSPQHVEEGELRASSPQIKSPNTISADSPQGQNRKPSRWDSPHLIEKKSKRVSSPQILEKISPRIGSPSCVEKNSTRTNSPQNQTNKSSRWDSTNSDSPKSTNKKVSRWDLPYSTEKNKKREDSPNVVAENKLIDDLAEGKESSREKLSPDLKVESSSLEDVKVPTISPTVDNTVASNVPLMSTPTTVEKVRINVDVANPLSTQIANILAASGNSMTNQRNSKSPKSSVSSPLKRKHSFEDKGVASDGDAVVAHVQSLCPQVKITRKERIISPSPSPSPSSDISQMSIALSNEQILTPKKPSRSSVVTTPTNLWQTDVLQPPTTSSILQGNDSQTSSIGMQSPLSRGSTTTTTQSPSPNKSPAASTGGRKQAGNTVNLPSSITFKQQQQQHKFAEALALADSVLVPSNKTTTNKRRSSQTTPTSNCNVVGNRRLNSAPALDVRSSPPAKISKMTTITEQPKHSPKKTQQESSSGSKTSAQKSQVETTQKQRKLDSSTEGAVEGSAETILPPATSPSSSKLTSNEEMQMASDVEQINSSAKITAVPIQPIPGYAETFLLCMLVNNMYKPINNIPHYLNTDLNQLVPVPPEAYEGMLPELVVDQPPPAPSNDNETSTESSGLSGNSNSSTQHRQMRTSSEKTDSLLSSSRVLGGESATTISSDGSSTDEAAFKLMLQSGDSMHQHSAGIGMDSDMTDNGNDNAIVLNLENQQIILDAATFEQLLSHPDANTQLVTDDGTEFVLTRDVLTALKAQQDSQNVELLHDQMIVTSGLSEAGSSSSDLLTVALSNSEFYGSDLLQIETSLGAGSGAAGLQLLSNDGSIVFQAPPLPQAHLTPPITAHTSETNAVLNQTPIMSTLEKPSTALASGKIGIDSPTEATADVISAVVECNVPGVRRNLDDSLAVIGLTTQSSTVPTSLELPITITNPAIAPKVTMAQSSSNGADLVQFQPLLSVASSVPIPSMAAHIFDDSIDSTN